jgi:tubulin-specific chaperone E
MIGQRVAVGPDRGTVRFRGQIDGTEWLGVEWDNPERGKHDGTHKGTRYFSCAHPTGGTFIKPAKVSFGCSFAQALKSKYGEFERPEQLDLVDSRNQRIAIQMVDGDRGLKRCANERLLYPL